MAYSLTLVLTGPFDNYSGRVDVSSAQRLLGWKYLFAG